MTKDEWKREFARKLNGLMQEYGMTQTDLGEMSGVSQRAISKYVNAECAPNMESIIAFSYIFGISCDELIDYGEPVGRAQIPRYVQLWREKKDAEKLEDEQS